MGMQWSSWALRPSITHIAFETTMCEASGVYSCSHQLTQPWIHRSIYPSIHPSIHQPTRLHIPPSVHPWTLERTHAHPSIPTFTQPAMQPTILASSYQSTSQPIQETIDRSGRLLHGCCRLRATKRALEREHNLKSIFLISCNIYIFQHVS
jgi:hypothetical protein